MAYCHYNIVIETLRGNKGRSMPLAIEEIHDMRTLRDYVNHGNKAKYLYFWGHQHKRGVPVGKSCFSQWYGAAFDVDGETYATAEHYMMAEKAILFGDHQARNSILACSHPGEAKKIGRNVKGFNDDQWKTKRFDIVVAANKAKFSQHERLKDYLLSTGNRVLVEASPVDKIWGVGLAEDNPLITSPNKWRGENLLGFALMNVRAWLRENQTNTP